MKPEKIRYARVEAEKAYGNIAAMLLPAVDRICFAGSLARGSQDVGDVEILFIPKLSTQSDDLFNDVRKPQTDAQFKLMLDYGVISKRQSVKGVFMWGDQNKLAVYNKIGIPIDFFAANEENWFNYLVCRTGPAMQNYEIAKAAQRFGWKWNPYGSGFSKGSEVYRVKSAQDVFNFVGLPVPKWFQ